MSDFRVIVRKYGQPFSEMLGINLKSRSNREIVKWFLASILYSKPIREQSATKTYRTFARMNVLSAAKVLKTGWDGLVEILDEGGYTRYDFSTADKLLEVFGNLERRHAGDLNHIHNSASDSRDLERKLKSLGKGIGDTTVSIFLRDMRCIWPKADPAPSTLVKLSMEKFGITDLKAFARANHVDLVRMETALLRVGKDFFKKGKPIDAP